MIAVPDFIRLLPDHHALRAAFRRWEIGNGGTYVEFIDQFYDDLDQSIYALQANPQLLQSDSEDRITHDLVLQLKRLGYEAEHDPMKGGHVDMSVGLGPHTWIGEAKKDGNFNEGLLQLMTRYRPASGSYAHNAGGLVFYLVKTPNAAAKLGEWKQQLQQAALTVTACAKNVLAFYSNHTHESSGTPYIVRTVAVALYHAPRDRSARASEKRKVVNAKKQTVTPTRTTKSSAAHKPTARRTGK